MTGKKVLYVSSEVIPYLPNNDISTLSYRLPKMVNENGGETRIFIPKYGLINERRHQLHEVIRLSGMNLIIDDLDMPLIIKVASIPKERMQVYFIDNDELNWSPDIIHIHGWITALMPIYLKEYYKNEPLFSNSKVIVSLYGDEIKGKLDSKIVSKLQFDQIESETLSVLDDTTYENLFKLAVLNSDGVILASDNVNESIIDLANKHKKPILICGLKEGYEKEYLEFYNTKILS
jgi:starch synthase